MIIHFVYACSFSQNNTPAAQVSSFKTFCSNMLRFSISRVFGLGHSAKTKPRSWQNSDFDQNVRQVTQFSKNNRSSGKPWRKLRGFQFRVYRLSVVQNGKLGVGSLGEPWSLTASLIIMPKRQLRGFQLWVFRFEYSAKWKARSLIKVP